MDIDAEGPVGEAEAETKSPSISGSDRRTENDRQAWDPGALLEHVDLER